MKVVHLKESLVAQAMLLGFEVRYDYFGGSGGGACELKGGKILFLDLAQSNQEQVEVLEATLKSQSQKEIA